jgi:hypothetical protein
MTFPSQAPIKTATLPTIDEELTVLFDLHQTSGELVGLADR